MTIYGGGGIRMATSHRRPVNIKRVVTVVALFLASVIGMAAGLVSMVTKGVDIFNNGLEIGALVLGGACVTLMINALIRD